METDQNICMDESVRPSSLDEFIGQEELRQNLKVYIQAAKTRGQAMDHTLFYGNPGLFLLLSSGIEPLC